MKTIIEENTLAVSLALQRGFDSPFSVERRPFLLDNGLNYNTLLDSDTYTTKSVINENGINSRWNNVLSDNGHVHQTTYTRSDFINNDGVAQVTGIGRCAGSFSEVVYHQEFQNASKKTICPKGNLIMVTLTSSQGTVLVCSHLTEQGRTTDFDLLVHTVAFPYILITQDKCLGWCSASLGSCMQEFKTGKLIRWDSKFSD